MILRGIEQAAVINTVVTIAKIVPLLAAVVLFLVFFSYGQFAENFFGGTGMPEKTLVAQVRDTMLITVFVFIGIEGASVYSRYAKTRKDVGAATIMGFLSVTGLMVAITLLPYATSPRASIAGVSNPSLAGALELVVGHWGAIFISLGVLVSVLGAYLAWSLICAEVLFAAAQSKDMPRIFGVQNANRVPANALWATNIVVSLFLISTYWSRDAFNVMLDMTSVSSLLPYLLVAGFGVLVGRSDKPANGRASALIFAWIAIVYTLFMFVAAGLKYVLLLAMLLAPGTLLYLWARSEQRARLFTPIELGVLVILILAALVAAYGLATGLIQP
jgi:arginine:ornithine antiporter/lysine permease